MINASSSVCVSMSRELPASRILPRQLTCLIESFPHRALPLTLAINNPVQDIGHATAHQSAEKVTNCDRAPGGAMHILRFGPAPMAAATQYKTVVMRRPANARRRSPIVTGRQGSAMFSTGLVRPPWLRPWNQEHLI